MGAPEEKHQDQCLLQRLKHFKAMDYHGIADILSAGNIYLRLFWIMVVLGATTGAAYMTYLTVEHYLSMPTLSKIVYLRPHNISYPTLTVCDKSSTYFLNRSKLKEDGVSNESVQLMLLSAPVWFLSKCHIPDRSVLFNAEALAFKDQMLQEFGGLLEAIQGFFIRYGIDCSSLFRSCRDANFNRIDCCQIFRPVMNFQHGLCFASDFGDLKIRAAGLFSNLFIKLAPITDLWVPPSTLSRTECAASNAAAYQQYELFLNTGVSQEIWHSDTMTLMLGEWNVIQLFISRIIFETDNGRDEPCDEEPHLDYFADYTFSSCMWERSLLKHPQFQLPNDCILPMVLLTKLGFSFATEKLGSLVAAAQAISASSQSTSDEHSLEVSLGHLLRGRPLCTADDILSYVFNLSGIRNPGSQGNHESIVLWMERLSMTSEQHCPPACDQWDFKYIEEKTLEDPKRSYCGLTLTLSETQYPVIKEVPALEWWDYVALVGGIWGLWIGTSVVTAFQLLVYCFQLLHKMRKRS